MQSTDFLAGDSSFSCFDFQLKLVNQREKKNKTPGFFLPQLTVRKNPTAKKPPQSMIHLCFSQMSTRMQF